MGKQVKRILTLATAAVLSVGLLGCGQDNDREKVVAPDTALYEQAAGQLIQSFSNDLKGALVAAMKDGGAAAAIEVCREKAPEIQAAYSGDGISISRVSRRNRSPHNAANAVHMAILQQFDPLTAEAGPIANWTGQDSSQTFHYYQPIRIGGLCLNCHGPAESIKPEVASVLSELYPDDQATGYQAGDLRGMFVVQIEWPKAEEAVKATVAGDDDRE